MPPVRGNQERRILSRPITLANRADGSGLPTIRGYAAVFDSESEDLGGFIETVAPGAFDETLARGHDVTCCIDHQYSVILGRTSAGTLRLGTDETGLWYEVDLADTQRARDLIADIKHGNYAGSSFTFSVEEENWERSDKGDSRRITKVELYELGPVVTPAYPATDVALRNRSLFREVGPMRLAESRASFLERLAKLNP